MTGSVWRRGAARVYVEKSTPDGAGKEKSVKSGDTEDGDGQPTIGKHTIEIYFEVRTNEELRAAIYGIDDLLSGKADTGNIGVQTLVDTCSAYTCNTVKFTSIEEAISSRLKSIQDCHRDDELVTGDARDVFY